MKHHLLKLAGLALAGAMVSTLCVAQQTTAACRQNAQAALTAFTHGKYAQVVEHFAPSIAGIATADKMQAAWTGLEAQFGAFKSQGKLAPHTIKGQPALVAEMTFAKGKLDAVIACNGEAELAAFQFVPPSTVARLEGDAASGNASLMAQFVAVTKAHEFKPHETIKAHILPGGARVTPLAVPSPFGPLPGALTVPVGEGPFPAVVLVQGSGQSDMDETIGPNKPFRDIAQGLAKMGVASLRYDKRGFVYPRKAAANKQFTVDDEVTNDALAALRLVAKQKRVDPDRVFVLGHSEGAMLVPRIVKRAAHIAGGIMLAAPARSLLTVMQDQVRDQAVKQGLPKIQIEQNVKALKAEQALLDKADPKHPPEGMFGNIPQSWLLSLHNYHQVAVAKALKRPLLFLQGGSDFQVSPTKDFDAWKHALEGHRNVTFHLFPGLSHLFRTAGKTGTLADYLKPGATDPDVINTIATWIKTRPPAQSL